MNIVLIGAGNVATHLGAALQNSGHTVVQVFSFTEESARLLAGKLSCGFTDKINRISDKADVCIIALKDRGVEDFLKKFHPKNKIVVHTSGSIPMDVFLNKSINRFGVFYPLQTFSKDKKLNFKEIPLCIEANTKATEKILLRLAKSVSENVYFVNSGQRKLLHIAAVFVNNFANHLFVIAEDILLNEKLPFKILTPLLKETFRKVEENSPSEIQTGPAQRGDKKIISEHLAYLQTSPLYHKIYKLLSESILKTGKMIAL